jgi:RNA binding exosome subunit
MNKQEKIQIKKQELQNQKKTKKKFNKLLEIMEKDKINTILETLDKKCKYRMRVHHIQMNIIYITLLLF